MKDTCAYKKTDKELPYPRMHFKSECGFEFVILDGIEQDEKSKNYGKMKKPSGTCMKCKKPIKFAPKRQHRCKHCNALTFQKDSECYMVQTN